MLRLCFRIARDLGRTVAELIQTLSWVEMHQWIAFYAWEYDQSLPPAKRAIRARTPAQAAAALDRAFGIKRKKP